MSSDESLKTRSLAWLRQINNAGWNRLDIDRNAAQFRIAQNERLIWGVFRLMAATALLYGLSALLGGPKTSAFPSDLIMLVGGLAITYVLLKKNQKLSGTQLLLITLNNTAAFIGSNYGPNSPVSALYGISIVLAGLMIGGVFIRVWCAVTIGCYWFVALVGPGFRAGQWPALIIWSASFVIVAALTNLFTTEIDRLMAEARRAEERERAQIVAERTRIAREIHDTLAQGFTGVLMQLNAAESVLAPEATAAKEHLNRARAVAMRGLSEARYSIWAVRGVDDDSPEIATSIRRMAEDLTSRAKVEVVSVGPTPNLPVEINYEVSRIGQEALTNAVRHANAAHIQVRLETRGNEFSLTVEDDGVGLPPINVEGFGIKGMKERAEKIGAKLAVINGEAGGTRVELRLTIEP